VYDSADLSLSVCDGELKIVIDVCYIPACVVIQDLLAVVGK
jgi:hypothetical protein